jgi:hypothetical protein
MCVQGKQDDGVIEPLETKGEAAPAVFDPHVHDGKVELPAPTVWPVVLAFGITLLFATPVMHPLVGAVGLVVSLWATVGWCYDALPGHGKHVAVPIGSAPSAVRPSAARVERMRLGQAQHRVRIPVEIHPYTAGILAGAAGGAAMAVTALFYGLVFEGSLYYPINLLAAALLPALSDASLGELHQLNTTALIVGVVLHGTVSILMGLVYVVMLPMANERPVLLGGIVMPILWTGLIWGTLGLVNPTMEENIHWLWFAVSQFVYGIVVGAIVSRARNIPTMQTWTLAERVGLEGASDEEAAVSLRTGLSLEQVRAAGLAESESAHEEEDAS